MSEYGRAIEDFKEAIKLCQVTLPRTHPRLCLH